MLLSILTLQRIILNNIKHQTVEIIKLNGSVELAPIVGLAEVIVDIVETGATLRENGLEVLEEVCPLSARMVVNQVSMKMEQERINKLINDVKKYIETQGYNKEENSSPHYGVRILLRKTRRKYNAYR